MKINATTNFTKIEDAFNKHKLIASLQGSSRSSKSYSATQWLLVKALSKKYLISVIRDTFPSLKRSILKDFLSVINDVGLSKYCVYSKSDCVIKIPSTGSVITFLSCTDEDRLKGIKQDLLLIDEANELRYEDYQQLQMRTVLFTILCYNPDFTERHWLNKVNNDKDTEFWISTFNDNPYCPDNFKLWIEKIKLTDPSRYTVYGLGQRAIVEGRIYPKINLVDSFPDIDDYKIVYGMDLGWQDPVAVVRITKVENNLYIDEVCYRSHMLNTDIINMLKSLPKHKIWCESAEPKTINEIYRAGFNIKPVKKGRKIESIKKVKEFNINITRHSNNLINEIEEYTFQKDKEGNWLDEPIDGNDHLLDAILYAVTMEYFISGGNGITSISF